MASRWIAASAPSTASPMSARCGPGWQSSMSEPAPLDLGAVGNCQVAALIDRMGRVVWMCLPQPDGDPVFNALLQTELGAAPNGVFAVELADLANSQQSYVRNTAILETVLTAADGSALRIVDFCPRFNARGRVF